MFNLSIIKIVYKKEILHILRDFETVFVMFAIPFLIYPFLTLGIGEITSVSITNVIEKRSKISINDKFNNKKIIKYIKDNTKNAEFYKNKDIKDIKEKNIDIIINFDKNITSAENSYITSGIILNYNETSFKSKSVLSNIRKTIWDYEDDLITKHLNEKKLSKGFSDPIDITSKNVVIKKKMAGWWFGMIFPMMFIVLASISVYPPSIELTAGEKEHKTIETLFTFPVNKINIILGKYLVVATIGIISIIANLSSIALTFTTVSSLIPKKIISKLDFIPPLSFLNIFLAFILTIPFILFVSSLMMCVASWAKNYKDAQNYLTPVLLICMLPEMLNMIPGFNYNIATSFIPVTSIALAFKELFQNNFLYTPLIITFITHLTLAFICLYITFRFFINEDIMFRKDLTLKDMLRKNKNNNYLSPALALSSFAIIFLIFFFIGSIIQKLFGKTGLIINEFFIILTPAIIFSKLAKAKFKEIFSDNSMPLRNYMLIPFYTFSAGIITVGITALQNYILPMPTKFTKMMIEFMHYDSTLEFLVILFLVGILPAFCEEMLFRGFILKSFKTKLSWPTSIFLTGILFGILHLSIYRFLPTAMLGIFMGILLYKTNSIWACMFMHFLNNSSIFILQTFAKNVNVDKAQAIPTTIPPSIYITLSILFILNFIFFLFIISLLKKNNDNLIIA